MLSSPSSLESLVASIPSSNTDAFLRERGYDLLKEYVAIVSFGRPDTHGPVVELATGTGRMASVLTRLGHRVITGDLTLEKRADALRRVSPAFMSEVQLLQLDMERLPFPDCSLRSIISVNTVHELGDPQRCIEELLRVLHPDGSLVVSDFNETGFGVLQDAHRAVFGTDHRRGTMDMNAVTSVFHSKHLSFSSFETDLNTTLVCTR